MYVHVCVHVCVCMYVHACVCMCVCVCTCMGVCACIPFLSLVFQRNKTIITTRKETTITTTPTAIEMVRIVLESFLLHTVNNTNTGN